MTTTTGPVLFGKENLTFDPLDVIGTMPDVINTVIHINLDMICYTRPNINIHVHILTISKLRCVNTMNITMVIASSKTAL